MDERTLTALKGSVEKWVAIERGDGNDFGTLNCPLCKLFVLASPRGCDGCPVKAETGQGGCGGSPYGAFVDALIYDEDRRWRNITCIDEAPLDEAPRLKRLARDEREFLESLLPDATEPLPPA